jgi:hypothetical protein
MNPQFPVYIVSKGRWESRLTSKAFEAMRMPYRIIVEEQEFNDYANVIDREKILVLDKAYQRDYDACDTLGNSKSKGPGPARNFAWDHAIGLGAERHWVVDDNISDFRRIVGRVYAVADGTIFRCMEDFCLRYTNIALAGPDYDFYPRTNINPIIVNTRIYSCILIRNDIGFRWRCRYNEDTDLCLRVLKAGWCTVQFDAFFAGEGAHTDHGRREHG